jgi:hypothetical protein
MLLCGAVVAGAITLAPSFASAADPVAPSTILANPKSYDGQSVSVAGTVKGFTTHNSPRGSVAFFQICDQQCVNVVDQTNATHANGDTVTVTGTFRVSFSAPRRSFANVVLIGQ